MPEYPFKDTKTGEPVDLVFSMADAPAIGDTIEHEGRSLVRLASRHLASSRAFIPHISLQARIGDIHAPRHNSEGECVFHSEREYHEYIAKVNDDPNRENLSWDP